MDPYFVQNSRPAKRQFVREDESFDRMGFEAVKSYKYYDLPSAFKLFGQAQIHYYDRTCNEKEGHVFSKWLRQRS